MLFEGNIAIKAALLSPFRDVIKILVDKTKKDRDTIFILKKAKEQKVPIEYTTRDFIDNISTGKTHGGFVAYVEDRKYQNLEDYLEKASFLALVEGIEDPYNFGYILRSLYAAGCDAIITNERNWSNAANVVVKASAGASEHLAHICVKQFKAALSTLKEHNTQIVCSMRDDSAIELYEYDFTHPICICIGGEKRGLSKEVLQEANQNVYIPYNSDFRNALNAVSATTILAFEIVRQRKRSK